MSKFVFPINALAYGESPNVRLKTIVRWCVYRRGMDICTQDEESGRKSAITHWEQHKSGQCLSEDIDWIRAWAGGADLCVRPGRHQDIVRDFDYLQSFLNKFWDGRTNMNTWLGRRLMWDFLSAEENGDEPSISYPRLAVLMAVNAVLGGKTVPYVITRDRINAMALGYGKSSALFNDDGSLHPEGVGLLKNRKDGAQPRTVRQIRLDLDFLEANGFFSRMAVNRRQTGFFDPNTVTREAALKWRDALPGSLSDRISKIREKDGKASR